MIKVRSKLRCDDELDMTALIDVVFILLIFFILAASYTVHSISFDLPKSNASKAIAGRVVEIRLLADGKVTYDGIPTNTDELSLRLSKTINEFKSHPGQFVLFADRNAPAGVLVNLVDIVRQHGGEKLFVATQPEDSK